MGSTCEVSQSIEAKLKSTRPRARPPLSLYIHFPWCVKKCPYCDFNSYETSGDSLENEYVAALKADLRAESELLGNRTNLHSIFMGGGTPSLFSAGAITKVLLMISDLFSIGDDTEITLEANPGTIDQDKFRGYFTAGVNRLSIGVQSFDDRFLAQLGRIHSANDALDAYSSARQAGFTNINIDMMHGLPGQTTEDAMQDLETAIALQSEHLSWYQLTIEPNTYFYKYPPTLPGEDQIWEMTEAGLALLDNNGFTRYEVSAFSKPQHQSQHNKNYWTFGDYLGIGAGAHGKISTTDNNFVIERTTKTRSPNDYLVNPNRQSNVVGAGSLALEFLMNALRLTEGFKQAIFEQRTGLGFDQIESFIQAGISRQLLEITNDATIRPTDLGMRYLDELLMLLD